MLVLYVQVCMVVCLRKAVCFFSQSASVVAFLALTAGSPPPAACDIGSWHPHVYSECRRMLPPPETFVLSKRRGVCPSKPLGKLSTTPVKRLQTTLKTAPSTTDVCFASTLVCCAWSTRIEFFWRILYTWVTLLCRLCLITYIYMNNNPWKPFLESFYFISNWRAKCLLQKMARNWNRK